MPTNPKEYIVPTLDLPDLWKYGINEKGQLYYYHAKILIPQWEPPIKLLPLMSDQSAADVSLKLENMDAMDVENDDTNNSDDDEDDVDDIISNSKMDAKRLLSLKSDPDLEKYHDDDSSSSDSDDSCQDELEMKLNAIREQTEAYWGKRNILFCCWFFSYNHLFL